LDNNIKINSKGVDWDGGRTGKGTAVRSCGKGSEASDFIRAGTFPEYLSVEACSVFTLSCYERHMSREAVYTSSCLWSVALSVKGIRSADSRTFKKAITNIPQTEFSFELSRVYRPSTKEPVLCRKL
jgi:hypothetical protein